MDIEKYSKLSTWGRLRYGVLDNPLWVALLLLAPPITLLGMYTCTSFVGIKDGKIYDFKSIFDTVGKERQ